jgi:hypothetical protein
MPRYLPEQLDQPRAHLSAQHLALNRPLRFFLALCIDLGACIADLLLDGRMYDGLLADEQVEEQC